MATKAKCPSGYTLKNGKCIGKDGKEVSAPYVSESGGFYPDQESLTSGCAKNPNSPKCQKIISTMSPEQRAKIKGIQKLGGSTKKYKKGGAMKKYEVGGMTESESCGKPGKPRCKKTFKSKGKSTETKGSILGTLGAIAGGIGGYAAYKKLKEHKRGGATKYETGGMVNPNAKLQAAKSAGSKGVKSGVNPKASASKVAKGRSGGTSAAPKTATPKAKYGMSVKRKK